MGEKARLQSELNMLEQEMLELSDNLSESQTAYKRARIDYLKRRISELDTKSFKDASNNMKQDMAQRDMMAAMAQGQGRA
jgi:hypothetical protein